MPESASWISARMRARVSPRHPPSSWIRWSISRDADFPAVGLAALALPLAFVPVFDGDLAFAGFAAFLPLTAGLRVPLARGRALSSASLFQAWFRLYEVS